MHFTPLAVVGFAASAMATLKIDAVPESGLAVGDVHEIQWSADRNYTLDLKLVRETSDGWQPVEAVFNNHFMASGSDSFLWVVPDVDSSKSYGLWLDGTNNPQGGKGKGVGYADLTPYFKIEGGSL